MTLHTQFVTVHPISHVHSMPHIDEEDLATTGQTTQYNSPCASFRDAGRNPANRQQLFQECKDTKLVFKLTDRRGLLLEDQHAAARPSAQPAARWGRAVSLLRHVARGGTSAVPWRTPRESATCRLERLSSA